MKYGCVVAGAIAMLSPKRSGRHPRLGTIYYWGLVAVFASATGLSVVRWAEDYHLFVLGALALACASLGVPPDGGNGSDGRRSTLPAWASPTFSC